MAADQDRRGYRTRVAAAELGDRKARNILSTHPDALVAANPGCLLQIEASLKTQGRALPTFHPIELVDASIRGVIPAALNTSSRHPGRGSSGESH